MDIGCRLDAVPHEHIRWTYAVQTDPEETIGARSAAIRQGRFNCHDRGGYGGLVQRIRASGRLLHGDRGKTHIPIRDNDPWRSRDGGANSAGTRRPHRGHLRTRSRPPGGSYCRPTTAVPAACGRGMDRRLSLLAGSRRDVMSEQTIYRMPSRRLTPASTMLSARSEEHTSELQSLR